MIQWEFKIAKVMNGQVDVEDLNSWGDEGWQMVTAIDQCIIFQRPKEEKPYSPEVVTLDDDKGVRYLTEEEKRERGIID